MPADARTYLARARDGAERLGAIVRAMSEASRMERAIVGVEGEDFDLAAVLRGCVEAYRPLAAPRRVDGDCRRRRCVMHGAPELIAQALDKLFDNARSFTPEDGWIRLSPATQHNDGAEIRVANSGPLLPPTMQERLFDSLVSMRPSAPARTGEARADAPHLGLGLYVVRLIADLHRGERRRATSPTAAASNSRSCCAACRVGRLRASPDLPMPEIQEQFPATNVYAMTALPVQRFRSNVRPD